MFVSENLQRQGVLFQKIEHFLHFEQSPIGVFKSIWVIFVKFSKTKKSFHMYRIFLQKIGTIGQCFGITTKPDTGKF